MKRATPFSSAALLLVFAAACGGEPDPEADAPGEAGEAATPEAAVEEPPPEVADRRVEIASPAEGDTVDAGPLTVTLAAYGFEVVPAGDTTPNSGHHHLFLDRDVSPAGEPIPAEDGYIIHIGTGEAEFTIESVEPGEHRLIAVVGDALHVPVDPPLADTIHFVAR